jgi:hypothetical protein
MPIKLHHVFHVYSPKTPFQFEALHDVSLVIELIVYRRMN